MTQLAGGGDVLQVCHRQGRSVLFLCTLSPRGGLCAGGLRLLRVPWGRVGSCVSHGSAGSETSRSLFTCWLVGS